MSPVLVATKLVVAEIVNDADVVPVCAIVAALADNVNPPAMDTAPVAAVTENLTVVPSDNTLKSWPDTRNSPLVIVVEVAEMAIPVFAVLVFTRCVWTSCHV